MKLIAESGATKTDWRSVSSDGSILSARTVGLNPTVCDPEGIMAAVREAVPVLNPEGKSVESVYFYGAGLVSEDVAAPIREALEMWCPFAEIFFFSDLIAAARALFGDGSGVVAIMGTGSNSCLYEEGRITGNIRPGGFILGDEGSGAALGKAFLADFIKDMVPEDIKSEFVDMYELDYLSIVSRVYRVPSPSAFLASFAPFLLERSHHPYVRSLIDNCLGAFMDRSLTRYRSVSGSKVGVVGSFGCACEDMLREAGAIRGLEFVKFIQSPIDELVRYHGI